MLLKLLMEHILEDNLKKGVLGDGSKGLIQRNL